MRHVFALMLMVTACDMPVDGNNAVDGGSPCDQPLPCESEPSSADISCNPIICTPVECDVTGRTCARCFQGTAYRSPYQDGVRWSDGEDFFTCRQDGTPIASGRVDAMGEVACVIACQDGHCFNADGEPHPICD